MSAPDRSRNSSPVIAEAGTAAPRNRTHVNSQRAILPFRVIDTHAGVGVYDLSGEEARKTGEWRDGIGRLMAEQPPEALRPLLAPYLDVVRALNGGAGLRR